MQITYYHTYENNITNLHYRRMDGLNLEAILKGNTLPPPLTTSLNHSWVQTIIISKFQFSDLNEWN